MRAPWEITRDSFLSDAEVCALGLHLRRAAETAAATERSAREVDRLIVECLLFSGLRCSEFCGLLVADTAVQQRESVLRVQGKRGDGRLVWIPAELSKRIRVYVRTIRPRLLPHSIRPRELNQPLFVNERGHPYERTAMYRRVVTILAAAGFGERASVQLLRHTYGYLAYRRTGGNLLFVQRQLGHAHPMVTSIYAQFVPESYADLAEATYVAPADGTMPAARRTHSRKNTHENL